MVNRFKITAFAKDDKIQIEGKKASSSIYIILTGHAGVFKLDFANVSDWSLKNKCTALI
jgi:signal-transduction protein with cAMP-binding, CBS, and nucleotidyltransferase domain